MIARAKRRFFWSVFTLLTLTACYPEPPNEITISKAPSFRPSSPKDVKSVQDALAAVITVCRDDLQLPVIDPLRVHVYKTTASFAFYAHPGKHPASIDRQAFAGGNEIYFNREGIEGSGDGPLVWLWAHEYAHNVQDRIGSAKTLPLFVNEGFADWVATRVTHFLKWKDHAIARHQTTRELIRHRTLLPSITSLHEDSVWASVLKQSMGSVRAHNLALFTMDHLIQKKGLDAVIAYLRHGDFTAAFGMPLSQVAAEVENSLVERVPKRAMFNELRPEWQPGYKWTYVRNDAGQVTMIVNEVVREEVFRGRPVFVVRSLNEETLYDKEDFTPLGIRKYGKLVMEVDKTSGLLSWPLEPRKEWRVTFKEKDLVKKSTLRYDQIMVITGVEDLRVGEGVLEAIKIESYGAVTGRLRREYWYSPKAKWFVKTRTYNTLVDVTDEELSQFDLKTRRPPLS